MLMQMQEGSSQECEREGKDDAREAAQRSGKPLPAQLLVVEIGPDEEEEEDQSDRAQNFKRGKRVRRKQCQ
jgi:hypothetical protein